MCVAVPKVANNVVGRVAKAHEQHRLSFESCSRMIVNRMQHLTTKFVAPWDTRHVGLRLREQSIGRHNETRSCRIFMGRLLGGAGSLYDIVRCVYGIVAYRLLHSQ